MITPATQKDLRPATLLILVVLVTGFYSISVRNGFVYDDFEVILEHPAPTSLQDIVQIFSERHFPELPYYRPVTRSSLLLQKSLHGDEVAVPFHLANSLLMGLTAWLFYALLRLPAFRISPLPGLWAAAMLALHPCASSCVYPIASGRETLLPTMLGILAVLGWLHGGRRWRFLSCLSLTAALFSKEQAIVLPVLFVVADLLRIAPDSPQFFSHPQGRITAGPWLRRYGPMAAAVAIYLGVRWFLFHGTELRWAVFERPGGPIQSLGYTIQTAVVPFLELVYEPPVEIWFSPLRMLVAASALGTLIVLAYVNAHCDSKELFFWLAWFFLALLPTANILDQEARFDERYVFPVLVPLLGLTASAFSSLLERGRLPQAVAASGLLLLFAAAGMSWNRSAYFEDEITFHGQWVRTNPAAVDAHVHLGLARHRQGRHLAAVGHFEDALRVRPGYYGAHLNLGNVFLEEGRFEKAAEQYRQTVLSTPFVRQRAEAFFNLGIALASQGKLDEATESFRDALAINAELINARLALASLLAKQGKSEEARTEFRRALEHVPHTSPLVPSIQNSLRLLDVPHRDG